MALGTCIHEYLGHFQVSVVRSVVDGSAAAHILQIGVRARCYEQLHYGSGAGDGSQAEYGGAVGAQLVHLVQAVLQEQFDALLRALRRCEVYGRRAIGIGR